MRGFVATTVLVAGLVGSAGAQEVRRLTVSTGAVLAYRDLGRGEPLLLLHGFGETGATWDPVVPELGRHYRLIVPDLRGHGHSSSPAARFTHRDAALDIVDLLDALGLDSVRAVGFSSGGMVLLHVATGHPEVVSHLGLVGTAPYLPAAAREVLGSIDADGLPMTRLEAMGLVHGDTAQARGLLRQFVALRHGYEDVNFTPPLLSTITASTLVIHGDRDPFFPVDLAVDTYAAVPGARLMVFPDLGHEAFPPDEPGRRYYLATLEAFLSGSWDRSR